MKKIIILIFALLVLLTSCSFNGENGEYSAYAIIRMSDETTIEKEIKTFTIYNSGRIDLILQDGTRYTTGINNVVVVWNTDKD